MIIVWNIGNNYDKKFKKEVSEYIIDALFFINTHEKDVIGEYSKLLTKGFSNYQKSFGNIIKINDIYFLL